MSDYLRFVHVTYDELTDVEVEYLPEGSAEWQPAELISWGPYPWKVYQAVIEPLPPGTEYRVSVGSASYDYMSEWSVGHTPVPEPATASMLLAGALLLSLLTKRRNHQCTTSSQS